MEKMIAIRLIELAAQYGIRRLREEIDAYEHPILNVDQIEQRLNQKFQRPSEYFNNSE